jgi:2-iminobutanoate/2-iminopropanoate deaminase
MPLRRIVPRHVHAPVGQYSHGTVIESGSRVIYVAGQVGAGGDGKVLDGIEQQIHQAWRNTLAVLEAERMTAANLVHINYYLTEARHVEVLRAVRRQYLPDPPPSSTAIIVRELINPAWLYEMDAVAAT